MLCWKKVENNVVHSQLTLGGENDDTTEFNYIQKTDSGSRDCGDVVNGNHGLCD